MPENKRLTAINTTFFIQSYADCADIAERYMIAYKEVALEEIARYHRDRIEKSSKKYLESSHEKMDKFTNVFQSFLKKMSNIVRSFEGFTPVVYDG